MKLIFALRCALIVLFFTLPALVTAEADSAAYNPSQSTFDSSKTKAETIGRYQREIVELQKSNGPYSPSVGEQLFVLGQLYVKEGRFEEAGAAFEQALHIVKVNDGLDSLTQGPILKRLILVNNELAHWNKLNLYFDSMFHLYQKHLDPGDPAMLNIVDTVGKWKLAAYGKNLFDDNGGKLLIDAAEVYQSHMALMEKQYGTNDSRLVGLLNALAVVRYQQVQKIEHGSVDVFQGFASRTFAVDENRNGFNEYGPEDAKALEINVYMSLARDALKRVIEIHNGEGDFTEFERATALVNLADWYRLNGFNLKSLSTYNEAVELLSKENGDTVYIDKLFGTPRPIPEIFSTSSVFESKEGGLLKGSFIKLKFDIDNMGKAKNIRIVEQSDRRQRKLARRAKHYIEASLFRPPLENGRPVNSKRVTMYLAGRQLEMLLD